MSNYNKQNRLDEKAVSVITDFFMNKHGDLFDLQFHGIKDNTPDTDGFLRLRQNKEVMRGGYLNKVVFFQLKGKELEIKNNSYRCDLKLIEFCKEINLPTILFVVGSLNEEAQKRGFKEIYWYYFSNVNSEILKNNEKNKSKRRINISNLEILKKGDKEYVDVFYDFIKNLAKKDSFQDLPKQVLDLSVEYKNRVVKIASMIYLLGELRQKGLLKIARFLKLSKSEVNKIISDLKGKKIVYSKNKLTFFKKVKDEFKRDVGLLLLHEGISQLNLEDIFKCFSDGREQKKILQSLSKVNHPQVTEFLNSHIELIKLQINKAVNNDEIFEQLDLLEQYIFRVPTQAVRILQNIINSKKKVDPVERKIKGYGKILGKSRSDLIDKAIDLLQCLRYMKDKKVFNLLLKCIDISEERITNKAKEAIKKIVSYDLFALQKVGYKPQLSLLDEIDRFKDTKMKKYLEVVVEILSEILKPSFEGAENVDYKTFSFKRGALIADKILIHLRQKSIELLKNIYLLSDNLSNKIKIIQALTQATRLPRDTYAQGLEDLILVNTNNIILFYIQIMKTAELEIIKVIEDQIIYLNKRFSIGLENIQELQFLIAQHEDYDMFKVFVGYDYNFKSEGLDWKESDEIRKQRIQDFVEQISEKNLYEWQNKILDIVENYKKIKNNDLSKYGYFCFFLEKFAKQKFKLAMKVFQAHEDSLGDFVRPLICGFWKGGSKKVAKEFIGNWIKEGKFLSVIPDVFINAKEIDKNLIGKLFKKAKELGDVETLNTIVYAIVRNYPEEKQYVRMFVRAIKILAKHKNQFWINSVKFQKKSILKELTERDLDVILESLLLEERIDFDIEEILEEIAQQFPEKVIKFLEKRVAIQCRQNKQKKRGAYYDAIPYSFNKLNLIFRESRGTILPEIFSWFTKTNDSFKIEASQLLKNIFSICELDKELVEWLNDKNEKMILYILHVFQGCIPLSSKVAQTIINKYPKCHQSLMTYMSTSEMGFVGESGFVDALRSKKSNLQQWKDDKRKYMQDFVKKYEKYLEKQIDFEKKRMDERVALMKREYE